MDNLHLHSHHIKATTTNVHITVPLGCTLQSHTFKDKYCHEVWKFRHFATVTELELILCLCGAEEINVEMVRINRYVFSIRLCEYYNISCSYSQMRDFILLPHSWFMVGDDRKDIFWTHILQMMLHIFGYWVTLLFILILNTTNPWHWARINWMSLFHDILSLYLLFAQWENCMKLKM